MTQQAFTSDNGFTVPGSGGAITLTGGNITGADNISATGNIFGNAITLKNTDDFAQIVFSSDGGTTNNGQIKVDGGTNMVVSSFNNFYVKRAGSDRIAVTDTTADFMASSNVRIQSNKTGSAYTWTFDNTGNVSMPGNISATGNVTAGYFLGNGSQLTGIAASYGNANVVANLAALGSNPVSTTGNITAGYLFGNGNTLSNVATRVTGSWTLVAGTNTVSLTVPGPGTYSIWVNGNIPNGIVTYTATAVVTNNNVPVVGSSYGWYYAAGGALVLTAIPNQFVGTVNAISNAVVVTTNAYDFIFGITNNSGNSAVVNYGYTKL